MARTSLLVTAALLAWAPAAAAQMDHDHGAAHGQPGRVAFPASCNAAAGQAIEQGVWLLHSFWYEEAVRTFQRAVAADTSCAMAQWGLASSWLHPLWAPPTPAEFDSGAAAATRARALAAGTHREEMYVAAIGAYYDGGGVPHPARLRRWEAALGRLAAQHPEDREAAIFHALSLIAVAQNSPRDTALALAHRASAVMEPLFAREPSHPGLAHYLIHAYDMPGMAAGGARAANRYAAIAPEVPHALHMPSHIYILLGQWDSAIAANRRSAAAAERYERETGASGAWDQRLHAYDYLAYAYLQTGRDRTAQALLDTAAAIEQVFPDGVIARYPLAAIPARYALERDRWADAAALELRPGLPAPAAAITQFARAVGAARSGDTARAAAAVAALMRLDSALAASTIAKLPGMVHAQRLTAESWLRFARADTAGALALARQAADAEDASDKHPVTPGAILPSRELLGDMLLEAGRAAEARAAYDSSLAMQPRRARGLLGAARAAQAAGDHRAAERYRRELRALLAQADPERRETMLAAR